MLYVDDFNRISNYTKSYPVLGKIFSYPRGHWFCEHVKNTESSVRRLLNRAAGKTVVLVVYNIPNRDLDGHSAGGAKTNQDYLDFISDFAVGIGTSSPIVIFEPDAIGHALSHSAQLHVTSDNRFDLMRAALQILSKTPAKIYIDLGHPRWLDWRIAVDALNKFKSSTFHGFSLNVSNFVPLQECIIYGQMISLATDKTFVIDTSRNGNEIYYDDWCNPPTARIGNPPTLETGLKNVDAFLWVKIPGESDGKARGGPNAGKFWPSYANNLIAQV